MVFWFGRPCRCFDVVLNLALHARLIAPASSFLPSPSSMSVRETAPHLDLPTVAASWMPIQGPHNIRFCLNTCLSKSRADLGVHTKTRPARLNDCGDAIYCESRRRAVLVWFCEYEHIVCQPTTSVRFLKQWCSPLLLHCATRGWWLWITIGKLHLTGRASRGGSL